VPLGALVVEALSLEMTMSKILGVLAVLGLIAFALPTAASAASKQNDLRAQADQYQFSSTYYYRRYYRPYRSYRPYYGYGYYRPYYRPYYYGYGYRYRPYYGYGYRRYW
jgi:hypothetical protein